MITIEEVQSIKSQFETDGITPASGETLRAVCDLAIEQHQDISDLRMILREAEHLASAEKGNLCARIIHMKDEIERLRAANKDLQAWFDDLKAEFDKARDALETIRQWADAYPLSVFPEPDFSDVRIALHEAGISLDSVSASNMRHVITGVKKIVDAALKSGEPK